MAGTLFCFISVICPSAMPKFCTFMSCHASVTFMSGHAFMSCFRHVMLPQGHAPVVSNQAQAWQPRHQDTQVTSWAASRGREQANGSRAPPRTCALRPLLGDAIHLHARLLSAALEDNNRHRRDAPEQLRTGAGRKGQHGPASSTAHDVPPASSASSHTFFSWSSRIVRSWVSSDVMMATGSTLPWPCMRCMEAMCSRYSSRKHISRSTM